MGKEVMIMRAIYLAPVAAVAMQLVACLPIDKNNKAPVAVATATANGMPIGATPIPFSGSPVSVVLNGSASMDKDGKIV